MNNASCVQVWEGVLLPAPTISPGAGGTATYRAQGSGSVCSYTYRTDPGRSFTYDASSGEVVVTNP